MKITKRKCSAFFWGCAHCWVVLPEYPKLQVGTSAAKVAAAEPGILHAYLEVEQRGITNTFVKKGKFSRGRVLMNSWYA